MLRILIERANSEHPAKLGILVKIYLISFDAEVFFCDICLLPGKMIAFFVILNILTDRHLQWPGKSRCSVE